MNKKPGLKVPKKKIEKLEEMFDDIIFYGWKDKKEAEIKGFLGALKPMKGSKLTVEIVMDELGDISNDFGEDCTGDWNSAGDRAAEALSKLTKKIETGFIL